MDTVNPHLSLHQTLETLGCPAEIDLGVHQPVVIFLDEDNAQVMYRIDTVDPALRSWIVSIAGEGYDYDSGEFINYQPEHEQKINDIVTQAMKDAPVPVAVCPVDELIELFAYVDMAQWGERTYGDFVQEVVNPSVAYIDNWVNSIAQQ